MRPILSLLLPPPSDFSTRSINILAKISPSSSFAPMFAVTFESRAFTAFRVVASLPFKSNSLTLTKEKEKKSYRTKRREGSEKKENTRNTRYTPD